MSGLLNPELIELLKDPEITDVVIHGVSHAFAYKNGVHQPVAPFWKKVEDIEKWIADIMASRHRDYNPGTDLLLDVSLSEGYRLNIVRGAISPESPIICIRVLSRQFSLERLIENQVISPKAADFLRICIWEKKNTLIFGGTGTGKTTVMNALVREVPLNERIVSIEDTLEISLPHENWSRLEAFEERVEGGRVTIRNLVVNSLRMLPERLIIGECRGKEAYDMVQAANTGHRGMITTLHANSTRDSLNKLENLYMIATNLSNLKPIRDSISRAFDILVHIAREDGKRRVNEITQVTGMEGEMITVIPLFQYKGDALKPTGMTPTFWNDILAKYPDKKDMFSP